MSSTDITNLGGRDGANQSDRLLKRERENIPGYRSGKKVEKVTIELSSG